MLTAADVAITQAQADILSATAITAALTGVVANLSALPTKSILEDIKLLQQLGSWEMGSGALMLRGSGGKGAWKSVQFPDGLMPNPLKNPLKVKGIATEAYTMLDNFDERVLMKEFMDEYDKKSPFVTTLQAGQATTRWEEDRKQDHQRVRGNYEQLVRVFVVAARESIPMSRKFFRETYAVQLSSLSKEVLEALEKGTPIPDLAKILEDELDDRNRTQIMRHANALAP